MAPIRRYLRITKYSVLEVRVYLDNPALAQTWLLNPRDPALPRVIKAIRPLVLPKLREENQKTKAKGKKQKGIKDVVSEDDFEVSIFLTDSSTPHSLLTKQKDFRQKRKRIKSNSGKLTKWLTGTTENPVNIDGEDEPKDQEDDSPVVIREESDDENAMRLEDYPEATEVKQTTKASRDNNINYVNEDVSDDEGFQIQQEDDNDAQEKLDDTGDDDKKKLALNTSYDGFSIYGRVLCLIVKRKGGPSKTSGRAVDNAGRQMLENWVSTQAAQDDLVGAHDE